MSSIAILEKLISFPTVSRDSNLDLISFVEKYLNEIGVECSLIFNKPKTKANLYATLGPNDLPGIMLSGHTDVVPVDGQDWSSDPFQMIARSGKLFGRGTADMKGFIACVLNMTGKIDQERLHTPIHLGFSYDEEIGCVGVRGLIDMMANAPIRPKFCIVGEPTSMKIVVAHKGKTAGLITCVGKECHSSLTTNGLNAIHLANEMISEIVLIQDEMKRSDNQDSEYEVAYTTLQVGVISGGTALNIVPGKCSLEFEIRHLPGDCAEEIIERLRRVAFRVISPYLNAFPDAAISVDVKNSYPALATAPGSEVVDFVKSLTGRNSLGKISFGTEGGLFSERLEMETVVIGPGSIDQAHKADEFIELSQMDECDEFLNNLVAALSG